MATSKKVGGIVGNPTRSRRKETPKSVAAGRRAAVEGDIYNFSLRVSKLKMTKFIFTAKVRGTTATKLLNEFIDDYLAKNG